MKQASISGNTPEILTKTINVGYLNLNQKGQLSICKMLETITNLKDEAILNALGALDFNRVVTQQYQVDFIEHAGANDRIVFQASSKKLPDNVLEITINAYKQQGKFKIPVVNGVFIFEVKEAANVEVKVS